MKFYVYHISDPRHEADTAYGYIGVTKEPIHIRFKSHARGNRIIGKAIRSFKLTEKDIRVLFSFESEDPKIAYDAAYNKELELRPEPFIGWNQCMGGRGGSCGAIPPDVLARRPRFKGQDSPLYGKKQSLEACQFMSKRIFETSTREERSHRASIGGSAGLGKSKQSENYSIAASQRPRYTCPHCAKEGQYNSMIAWHGDACKKKAT